MNAPSNWTQEQEHLETLLKKCRMENDPKRLFNHLQAVKTFLLAHLIQQSTLLHQIEGKVVEGDLEDRIIKECSRCVGDTQKVMHGLHDLLRKFDDERGLDSMEFRVESTRLLGLFDRSMVRFRDWFSHYGSEGARTV